MDENTYVENPAFPGEGVNKKGQRVQLPAAEGGEDAEASGDQFEKPEAAPAPAVLGVTGPDLPEGGPDELTEGVDVEPKGTEIDLTEGDDDAPEDSEKPE